ELLIGFGEVNNALHQANDAADGAATDERKAEHNQPFGGVAENEFMHAEHTQQNAANAGGYFFVVGRRLWRVGRLIVAAGRWDRRLIKWFLHLEYSCE